MGQFDNFENTKAIVKAQKELDKLCSKKKLDNFKIELARKKLEHEKLFEHCQRFLIHTLNGDFIALLSDENRVMRFADSLIAYDNIDSYSIVANNVTVAHTKTKSKGSLSRAVVGGVVAGGVGAVVGALSASSKAETTYAEQTEGFFFCIWLKDGSRYRVAFPGGGLFSNKVPKEWLLFGERIKMIIEEQAE